MVASIVKYTSFFLISIFIICLAVGEFILWQALPVSCSNHEKVEANNPVTFVTNAKGQGPFRGERWSKLVDTDLSQWYLKHKKYESIIIKNKEDGIDISSWWIPSDEESEKRTVIIVHGINGSKKQFNQLIPANIIANSGLNVLMIDVRNHGESSCPDGWHFAGIKEWKDVDAAIEYLIDKKGVPESKIGIHAVSGGGLGTFFLIKNRKDLGAFSLDSGVFDWDSIVQHELEYHGVPGFTWQLAIFVAKFHGIFFDKNLPKEALNNLQDRPLLVFHGTEDTRVPFFHSVQLVEYVKSINGKVTFFPLEGADHTEGVLSHSKIYEDNLPKFFKTNL